MHILVFGNSGAGKSTLCRDLASKYSLQHLDLDSIVWEPQKVAVQRSMNDILASLDEFLDAHSAWVIVGD